MLGFQVFSGEARFDPRRALACRVFELFEIDDRVPIHAGTAS
jgi:hypothetical protein